MQFSKGSSFLQLPISDESEFWKNQPQTLRKSVSNTKQYIPKNQMYSYLMEVFSQDKSYPQLEQKLQMILVQQLNQLYDQIHTLPKQLYVCGHCKDYYSIRSQYLLHCILLSCPINHYRSSILFRFKNNQQYVKNQDFENNLKKEKLLLLKQVNLSVTHFFIGNGYQLQQVKNMREKSFICGSCQAEFTHQDFYVRHCIFKCRSEKLQANSHLIKAIESPELIQQFKKNVENLVLNYNLLIVCKNSYLRIFSKEIINPNAAKNQNEDFQCGKCQRKFIDTNQLLQHKIFDCSTDISQKSTHLIQKRILALKPSNIQLATKNKQVQAMNLKRFNNKYPEQIQSTSNQRFKQKINLKYVKSQSKGIKSDKNIKSLGISSRRSIQSHNLEPKSYKCEINKKFKDYQHLLQSVFWCSLCSRYFQTSNLFIVHCLYFLCPINHHLNSHFYYLQGNQRLTAQDAKGIVQTKKHRNDVMLPYHRGFKFDNYDIINSSTHIIQTSTRIKYSCGGCNMIAKRRFYIPHLLFSCSSPDNLNNSHIIQLKKIPKDKKYEELKTFELTNTLVALQIIKIVGKTVFIMKKKARSYSATQDNLYVCGQCMSEFESAYVFLYHCLTVCQNINHEDNSHQIFKKSCQKPKSPLEVILHYGNTQQSSITDSESEKYIDDNRAEQHSQHLQFSNSNSQQQQNEGMCNIRLQSGKKRQSLEKQFQHLENQMIRKSIQQQREQRRARRQMIMKQRQQKKSDDQKSLQKVQQTVDESKVKQENDKKLCTYVNLKYRQRRKPNNLRSCRYFCGGCRQYFKNKQTFTSHIQKCGNLQHQQSSHHIMTRIKRMNVLEQSRLYGQQLIKDKDLKEYDPGYELICGCGKDFSTAFAAQYHFIRHARVHQGMMPPGSSHILIQLQIDDRIGYLAMRINDEQNKFNQKHYACGCKPRNRMTRKEFVHHVIKKHKGIAPNCYMERQGTTIDSQVTKPKK